MPTRLPVCRGKASTRHRHRRQKPCLELTGMQAPGRQAGWEGLCQEESPLLPKVAWQQLRPKRPGWLSLGLGGIWGDLWGLGGTGHHLPSRYIQGRSTGSDICGSVLTKGAQDPPPLMLPGPPTPCRDSHTQTGRRLAAWQSWGLATSAMEPQGAPRTLPRVPSP